MLNSFLITLKQFIKKDIVLAIAVALALVSSFLVPPNPAYGKYVDWNTLALLFSLMAVVKLLQNAHVFTYFAGILISKASDTRLILAILVFLPFAASMFITNDVALITFVPFGLEVLKTCGQRRLIIPMAVLQTIAANLGSMATPMGNPQNLYLYEQSGESMGWITGIMAPYAGISFFFFFVIVLFTGGETVEASQITARIGRKRDIAAGIAGFVLCIMALFDLLPVIHLAVFIFLFMAVWDKKSLFQVDYSLLLTFIAFFIFIGNTGSLSVVRDFMSEMVGGHTEMTAILASQIVSNVPAALLLSGFTDNWEQLVVGCNLGGLGTLIASMASLISYKFIAGDYPELKTKYIITFTVLNVMFLAVLLIAGIFL